MSRSAWFAIAVWVAGFGAMGGVAYALNRPLVESRLPRFASVRVFNAAGLSTTQPTTQPTIQPTIQPAPSEQATEESHILRVGVIEIVGHVETPAPRAAPPPAPRAAPPPTAGDIAALRCSEWRDLEQGSAFQRVRICE